MTSLAHFMSHLRGKLQRNASNAKNTNAEPPSDATPATPPTKSKVVPSWSLAAKDGRPWVIGPTILGQRDSLFPGGRS